MERAIAERLERALGLNGQACERATQVVLSVLSEELPPAERSRFLRALPGALAQQLAHDAPAQSDSLEGFYARVAQRAALELGHAVEQTQVVCAALAEELEPDALHHLRSRLPESFAPLFDDPGRHSRPPEAPHGERRYTTLAEGRPGSRHPVSESHPERAHQDSIARSENPHGESKLSTSEGETQVREGETLASGKPGAPRPLGSGKQ